MGDILIVAEQHGEELQPASRSAMTFGAAVAEQLGAGWHIVAVGHGLSSVADELAGYGAKSVLLMDHPALEVYLAETYAPCVAAVAKKLSATVIGAASTAFAKDLLPRVTALLDAGMVSVGGHRVRAAANHSTNGGKHMKIIEALLGEHAVFYAQFDHLEQAVPAAETLAQVQSQAALLTAALETHANLEDDLLFAALDPHLGSQMGPLAVMRMEHDEIRGTLAGLPEAQDLPEAQRLVLHAVQVAREHFAKEEQVLYPMAEQTLDADALTQLGARWAEQRGVSIG
ncbi:MAG: hemerythrin domain-containing protein [Anaerolineae bacterium]